MNEKLIPKDTKEKEISALDFKNVLLNDKTQKALMQRYWIKSELKYINTVSSFLNEIKDHRWVKRYIDNQDFEWLKDYLVFLYELSLRKKWIKETQEIDKKTVELYKTTLYRLLQKLDNIKDIQDCIAITTMFTEQWMSPQNIIKHLKIIDDLHEKWHSIKDILAIFKDPRAKEKDFGGVHFYCRPNSVKVNESNNEKNAKDKLSKLPEAIWFYNTHKKYLLEAESRFKVPWEIIVSIIASETNFGKYKLTHNPFNTTSAILTDMFIPITTSEKDIPKKQKRLNRIDDYMTKCMTTLLDHCIKTWTNPFEIKSNLLGATGYPQFMPANYKLIIDWDKDWDFDLSSFPDAILSVWNYFAKNWWKWKNMHSSKEDLIKSIKRYNNSDAYANWIYDLAKALQNENEHEKINK